MRKGAFSILVFLVVSSLPALALADVPSGPSCKCEAAGQSSRGTAAAALCVSAASIVLVARKRRKS